MYIASMPRWDLRRFSTGNRLYTTFLNRNCTFISPEGRRQRQDRWGGQHCDHLQELEIANTPSDPRHVLPDISGEHQRILDVGCGAGQTLIACGVEGPHAFGVDVNLDALRLGKKLSEGTKFVRATGEALPFPNDYFDLVISRVALPYMRIVDAVAEMQRVLRPGGGLWLTLHGFAHTKNELVRNLRKANIKALFQLYVLGNGLLLHLFSRQWSFPFTSRCESFQTSSSMRRILLAAGFENICIHKRRHFVVTAEKGWRAVDSHSAPDSRRRLM